MPEVHVLGALRRRLGAKQLSVSALRVAELLDELVRLGDPSLRALFYADPRAAAPSLHPDLRVLVNGRSVAFLAGLDTRLEDRDRITLHLTGARGFPGG